MPANILLRIFALELGRWLSGKSSCQKARRPEFSFQNPCRCQVGMAVCRQFHPCKETGTLWSKLSSKTLPQRTGEKSEWRIFPKSASGFHMCMDIHVPTQENVHVYAHIWLTYTCKKRTFVFMLMSYTGVQFFFLVTSLSCSVLQVVLASKSMLGGVLHSEMQKKVKLGFSHNTQCFCCELQMYGGFFHTPASNRFCSRPQQSVLWFSSTLTLSTWNPSDPTGWGLSPKYNPTSSINAKP